MSAQLRVWGAPRHCLAFEGRWLDIDKAVLLSKMNCRRQEEMEWEWAGLFLYVLLY